VALAGCASAPSRVPVVTGAPIGGTAAVPPGMQYLYGSGEAAAISVQAWQALVAHVAARVRARPVDSVVLAEGATLAAPRFAPCGTKPLAAVFDVDETVLLNLGFESDDAAHPGRPYDERRWQAWERSSAGRAAPVPGAREGLSALRGMGVTVVFNTNRSAAGAAATEALLAENGLGPARHGETLFLSGDDATGGHKDARRRVIAARYCVVAMAGDQLGDFSDLFNAGQPPAARRAAVLAPPLSRLWGDGWFVLPNPVYGTALRGGVDEVFPADRRWSPPQEKN
jgi:5'-nucleotidase (lipoprotein e(P4) family)